MLSKGGASGNKPSLSYLFGFLRTHFRRYSCSPNPSTSGGDGEDSVDRLMELIKTRSISRTLNLEEALGYFNSMVQMQPMPSIWAFNQLLGALSNMSYYSTVISMYRELMGFGYFRPGISTLTVVIKCFFGLKRVDLGLSVWGTIVKSGLRPDAHVLCAMLHGLFKDGSVAAATGLFREIVEKGYPCNEITYATVINGFCKAGDTRKALALLERMCREGGIRANVGCFNPIFDGLCKEGRVDEALRLFQDMLGRGVPPDVFSYTSLIHGFGKSGRWDEANSFLMEMLERGVLPNVRTYTSLIHLLCKEDKIQKAIALFEFMTGKGVKPDVVIFNSMVSALCKSGQWKEVSRLLENMARNGISPGIVIFNIMLDARCKEGSTVEALHLVETMNDKGLVPNVITYGCLLSGLCHSGKLEEATKLFDDMASQKVFPDITTLNIILNALSNQGMMEKAQRFVETMIEHGKELDTITYNTLIKGYCLQGEMDKANDVFEGMATKGALHDTFSYNTLANGYTKSKNIGFALRLLKDLIYSGLPPDKVTRNIVKSIHAYRHESSLIHSQQVSRVMTNVTAEYFMLSYLHAQQSLNQGFKLSTRYFFSYQLPHSWFAHLPSRHQLTFLLEGCGL